MRDKLRPLEIQRGNDSLYNFALKIPYFILRLRKFSKILKQIEEVIYGRI